MLDPAQVRGQPNLYTCGPAALRHALLCHGAAHSIRDLALLAGTTPEGTDDAQMADAARELGYRLDHILVREPDAAYKTIRELLDAQTPVILCVDHYSHWVCAVKATSRHLWLADSALDGSPPPLVRLTWRAALQRLIYGLPDELRFDLYPLMVR